MRAKKQVRAAAKETTRTFRTVVGPDTYEVWVRMLRKLVPDGRTHRLAVMLAGMLQYAVAVAASGDKKGNERSLAFSLLEASDATEPNEVEELIHDAVVQLFKGAI